MFELLEALYDLERVVFIFNPALGGEETGRRRATLDALAREAGLTCTLAETDEQAGADPLAREAAQDGPHRRRRWHGAGVELAVIPGGTGNLLALHFGLPVDPAEAIRCALTGAVYPTDVGRANGRVFLLLAGIGFDAQLIRDADRELKNRLGPLAYFVAGRVTGVAPTRGT